MMFAGALTNALAFTGSSFLFSQLGSSKERDRHNKAIEQLTYDRDQFNQERLKRIDYLNTKLKQQGHAIQSFHNADEALRQYYLLTKDGSVGFGGELGPEPKLEDYLNEDQISAFQKGELLVVGSGMLIAGYFTWKYI